jgi:hypothetical protein
MDVKAFLQSQGEELAAQEQKGKQTSQEALDQKIDASI